MLVTIELNVKNRAKHEMQVDTLQERKQESIIEIVIDETQFIVYTEYFPNNIFT